MDLYGQISAYGDYQYIVGQLRQSRINPARLAESDKKAIELFRGFSVNPLMSDILGQIESYGNLMAKSGRYQGLYDITDNAYNRDESYGWGVTASRELSDIGTKLS